MGTMGTSQLQIEPRWLDVDAAAQYVCSTAAAVYHLVERGQLRVIRRGRRIWLDREDIDRWMLQGKQGRKNGNAPKSSSPPEHLDVREKSERQALPELDGILQGQSRGSKSPRRRNRERHPVREVRMEEHHDGQAMATDVPAHIHTEESARNAATRQGGDSRAHSQKWATRRSPT